MAIRHIPSIVLALACLGDVSSVLGGQVQSSSITLPSDASQNRIAVNSILADSWNSYLQFAFPQDDLIPTSKSGINDRNGWSATVVDALSTLFVIGQDVVFESAVNYTATINFNLSSTAGTVSVFETTIRYIGGMLSAYELSGNKYPALLSQAKILANKLSVAWVGSNAVPFPQVDFSRNQPALFLSTVAEAGSLTLEWWKLAQYTGNDRYRQLAEKSVRHLAKLPAPIPGIPAQGINPSSGRSVGDFVTWGGGTDSYLEYLIKYARLTNTNDNVFADTWATAVDSSMRILARTSTIGNHQYVADLNSGRISHVGSHLACFLAGNWLLGGKLLNNDTIVNFALAANEACWNTYASTATGIGPEAFGYFSSDGTFTGTNPSRRDIDFYNKHGFFILPGDTFYDMRPEVLESNFYAWRVTGDTKYYQRAVSAVNSFKTFLKAPAAYSPISNVNSPNSGFMGHMESFWFAEVLKYLYLTFDDPSRFSLDDYVFNTEGHLFKAPAAKPVYGSGKLRGASEFTPFKTNPGAVPQASPKATGFHKSPPSKTRPRASPQISPILLHD